MSINNKNDVGWYLIGAKTLRIGGKLSMSKLAGLAQVSRDSISNIEKHHPVSEVVIEKVFSALNTIHNGKLDRVSYIKNTPEK